MATEPIADLVAKIRSATYGREVRESIAAGIETCYSDVTEGKTTAEAAADKITDMTAEASSLAEGASPTVAVSEVDGHKHLAFGIPKGDTGNTGAVPNLTVGTVTAGETGTPASVTRRSGSPDTAPVFDFVLPKGNTGAVPNITVGSVTTAESGQPAVVTRKSGSPDTKPVFDFILPKGNTGDTGAVPNIKIGTVTTLNPDQSATVTRRTGSPDTAPVFDFAIPKGETGSATNVFGSTVSMTQSDPTKVNVAIEARAEKTNTCRYSYLAPTGNNGNTNQAVISINKNEPFFFITPGSTNAFPELRIATDNISMNSAITSSNSTSSTLMTSIKRLINLLNDHITLTIPAGEYTSDDPYFSTTTTVKGQSISSSMYVVNHAVSDYTALDGDIDITLLNGRIAIVGNILNDVTIDLDVQK